MNLRFLDDFLDLASTALLETLILEGYPLCALEDHAELAKIVSSDEAFAGYRKYEARGVLSELRAEALETVNRLMVAELPPEGLEGEEGAATG